MKDNKLVKNTMMLYILSFSNYLFGFITVPHLTRVLGPTVYGRVGVGQAFAIYVQLFLDFGFILSATSKVAANKDNKEVTSKTYLTVMICKVILVAVSLIVLFTLILTLDFFASDPYLYLLFWAYMAVNTFIPDFLYRGLEKMEIVTLRTVILKFVFMIGVFIFIKNESQYLLVPVFYFLGALFSVIFVFIDIVKEKRIQLVKVGRRDVIDEFKSSGLFFISRIAGTVFTAMNTLILGIFLTSDAQVGYYTASDKIVTAGHGAITPISDSLYPHMVKEKNYRLAKKFLLYGSVIMAIGCAIVEIYAQPVCSIIFGNEYSDAAGILRLMIPLIFISYPSYIIAFPILTPLGMVKYANTSVVISSIVQAIGLLTLITTKYLTVYTLCGLTIVSQTVMLIIRVGAMVVGIKKNGIKF